MDSIFLEPGWGYRLPLYIILGIVSEFLMTAMSDLVSPSFLKSWNVMGKDSSKTSPSWRITRDPRALGYSFLWMLPIYALFIFVEPAKEVLGGISLLLRAVIYVLVLWSAEYATGFLIKQISGRCPWDYSASRWNLHGFIRFDFFPLWYGFVIFLEWMSVKFVALTPALQMVFKW